MKKKKKTKNKLKNNLILLKYLKLLNQNVQYQKNNFLESRYS